MTKKKSKGTSQPAENASSLEQAAKSDPNGGVEKLTKIKSPEQPTLVICRNKHWRYISSYHGPWLQLPPEVLESLAYSNFHSPRPQPIDPAVFFDLVKIRRLVDDATSLAVRAANGTTSASLSNSLSASNGILNGSDAEILGIGVARGGGNAKLSRERKHRMREHATQKLSHAYHLDEIATSVATMQSASALEEVAKLVLQRSEIDPDAQYVHFFHEKIPSRAMAEYTSLAPLDDIIRQRPTDGSPYRTRAVTRIFKEDFIGAARDLTDGLGVHRLYSAQHRNEKMDLILARDAAKLAREYRADAKVEEKDQPSSLEVQLLFHRGGTYLTLACNQIEAALRGLKHEHQNGESSSLPTQQQREEHASRQEARKLVRTYAKRALRDYTSFLGHFDYTPGLPAESAEAFLQKVNAFNSNGKHDSSTNRSRSEKLLDIDAHSSGYHSNDSSALIPYTQPGKDKSNNPFSSLPTIPKPTVHPLSSLFSALPPSDLPPYPAEPTSTQTNQPMFSYPAYTEAVTYHPLLTDVLHSLLLTHSLLQTSTKEHSRHAYNAARLARLCDGYPIFLAARSPARADWIEVLRRTRNWLSLQGKWEDLCAPAPLPGQEASKKEKKAETEEEKSERRKREAIQGALADERVFDEDTFRASVRARELRAAREEEEEQRKEYLRTSPSGESVDGGEAKRWAQEDGKEYPITTERADVIARWIREAPAPSSGEGGKTKKGKRGRGIRLGHVEEAADVENVNGDEKANGSVNGMEKSIESLDIVD